MRVIQEAAIRDAVAEMSMTSNYELSEDIYEAIERSLAAEPSPTGRKILQQLLENAAIARRERLPICQDCGRAVVFAEIGQEVYIDGDFERAVNDGVVQGYREGYLRKSTCHPLTRENLGTNEPAIIYSRLLPGDRLKLIVAPKGGGSDNTSDMTMLPPAAGRSGIVDYILEKVRKAGPNPCPPIVVGVGIGSNFEGVALLAKKALLRAVGSLNPDPAMAAIEEELLAKINALGIGPAGLGGRTTALAVHVEIAPCHIASLPVAISINCHAARHKSIIL